MTRRHSGSATEPSDFVGSPQSTTRVTPSGCSGVGVVTTAARMPALLSPRGRSTGHQRAGVVEVVLDQGAAGAGEHRLQLVGVDQPAPAGADAPWRRSRRGGAAARSAAPRPRRPRRRPAGRRSAPPPGAGSPSGTATRPWASTSSMPAPSVSGRILLPSAVRPSTSMSTTGQTWTQTWFMSSLAPARRGRRGCAGSPRGSSPPRARRAAGR